MITIADIARATGLSTATVSNALSGKGRVSDGKRRLVVQTARDMGYDFQRIRGAAPRRSIAVIVESLSSIFCVKIAEGVCRAAGDGGFHVRIHNQTCCGRETITAPRGSGWRRCWVRRCPSWATARWASSTSRSIPAI